MSTMRLFLQTARVVIITKKKCPHCVYVTELFNRLNIQYNEYHISSTEREELREATGGAITVPQIFVRGKLVGDAQRIRMLLKAGNLFTHLS